MGWMIGNETFVSSFSKKDNPSKLETIIQQLDLKGNEWSLNIIGRFNKSKITFFPKNFKYNNVGNTKKNFLP